MEEYFEVVLKNPLFVGISREEAGALLNCLSARIVFVSKGEPAFLEGDQAGFIGLVLEGSIQIVRDDYYGSRTLLTHAEPGDLFAESFACAGMDTMPVSAYALRPAKVMLFDLKKMLTVCSNACRFHNLLIQNLLQVVAQKNLPMSRKMQFMSRTTTQEKLMAYLLDQAKQKDAAEFDIPLDRQTLADYLGVERSAMSAELSKLRKAGYIDYQGAHFKLLKSEEV